MSSSATVSRLSDSIIQDRTVKQKNLRRRVEDSNPRTIEESMQCVATTTARGRGQLNGHRCRLRTAKSNMCWMHLKKMKGLRIKKSTIPGAGMGLFTEVPRRKNENVAAYSGDILIDPPDDWRSDYALELARGPPMKIVDAKRSITGPGRFSNTKPGHNNAKLMPDRRNNRGTVRATRPIPAGREVFTTYGSDWRRIVRGP